jgi:integrase
MSANPSQITNKTIRQLSAIRMDELNDCRKLAKLPLWEAGKQWLETRKPFIDPRTARDYWLYIVTLVKFFGNVPLERLANPDLFRAYQLERSKTCAAYTVNKELSCLQQLLKRIRKWDEVKPYYEAIPLPRESPGRALTPEEERSLLQAGASRPGLARAHNLVLLSLHTAAGPSEMLGLRLRDVFVDNPDTARIYIHEHAKNKNRVREVPLNVDALGAVTALLRLAKEAGSGLPEHYLVPYRITRDHWDPTRHALWPKTAFNEICAAAGVKIRPYDLRHTGLTKLAEKNPEQVVLKIAGHVSPQMLRKVYAHVRLPALRSAVDSIGSVAIVRADTTGLALKESNAKPQQTLFRVAEMAEQLGISGDKALQLLIEYERQQALARGKK